MKTNSVKEKIIDATTELIGECLSIDSVTIRDIAAKAGVGVGLINYHFQKPRSAIEAKMLAILANWSLIPLVPMVPVGTLFLTLCVDC